MRRSTWTLFSNWMVALSVRRAFGVASGTFDLVEASVRLLHKTRTAGSFVWIQYCLLALLTAEPRSRDGDALEPAGETGSMTRGRAYGLGGPEHGLPTSVVSVEHSL